MEHNEEQEETAWLQRHGYRQKEGGKHVEVKVIKEY